MKKADVVTFFDRLAEAIPIPKGELEYINPYTLLVAVVLSAQATDVGVNRATKVLFERVRTPEEMLALGEATLKDFIKTIGLYNSKAKNIIALSRILAERHGSQVPPSREVLETLPGVGRKTANVVLNTAFGEPTIAVDTHIFRVANRTGLAPGKTPRAVEDRLLRFTPEEFRKNAHHWLILHGRYVCKARRPECPACIIADLCEYRHKNLSHDGS
jgi:endonuclease-3